MDNNVLPFKPEQILQLIIKRRWVNIVPFLLSVMTGCYLAVTLPKVYESTTSILVQPQKVPGAFVKSIVSSSINSRISTISQQILSRTNLEKIIEEFRLLDSDDSHMSIDSMVAGLRKRIKIEVGGAGRNRLTSMFTIAFRDKNPEGDCKHAC